MRRTHNGPETGSEVGETTRQVRAVAEPEQALAEDIVRRCRSLQKLHREFRMLVTSKCET